MNIKTFLISLEREKDRRAKVVYDLERLGLDYSILNAVDGYSLTDKELKELCDVEEIKNKGAWFTKGVIGCCLSHYMLYKKVIAEDLPYPFIIEDDVKLSDNIRELLVKAVEFISKDEVILFYYQSDGIQCPLSNINSKVLVGKFKLHYPMLGNLNCTGAYN